MDLPGLLVTRPLPFASGLCFLRGQLPASVRVLPTWVRLRVRPRLRVGPAWTAGWVGIRFLALFCIGPACVWAHSGAWQTSPGPTRLVSLSVPRHSVRIRQVLSKCLPGGEKQGTGH